MQQRVSRFLQQSAQQCVLALSLVACLSAPATAQNQPVIAASADLHQGLVSAPPALMQFERGAPMPTWAQPLAEIPAERQARPVAIRVSETQIYAGDQSGSLLHRVVQVNAAKSWSEIGQVTLSFSPHFQKMLVHRLSLIRDGQELDRTQQAQVRFVSREPSLDQGIYSGSVNAVFLIPDARVGDALRVVVTTLGANPVFAGNTMDSTFWDGPKDVDLRRVTVIYPKTRPVLWKMHAEALHNPLQPSVSETRQGLKVVRFEQTEVAGIEREAGLPSDYFPWRWLQISAFQSWQDVARWADGLFAPQAVLPASLEPLVATWRALPSQHEQVAQALKWVQEEIRYFSDSLGERSHLPYPPEVVVERRYGDCKDKSLLLVTVLKALGIEAHPVMLSMATPRFVSRTLPTVTAFDHVITQVRVGDEVWYLDPTKLGQLGELGRQGNPLQDHLGLVVAADTTALTPLRHRSRNQPQFDQELDEQLAVGSDGQPGQLRAQRRYYGLAAERVRAVYAAQAVQGLRQQVVQDYQQRYKGISLAADPSYQDDTTQNVVTVSYELKLPSLGERGDYVALSYFPTNLSGAITLPRNQERRMPALVNDKSQALRYRVQIQWPKHAQLQGPWAPSQNVSTRYYDLAITRQLQGHVASVEMVYRSRDAVVPAGQVAELMNDVRKLDDAISGKLVAKLNGGKADVRATAAARSVLGDDQAS